MKHLEKRIRELETKGGIGMQDLNLNINEIIESMASEIATLIKQVYIKNAEIKALREVIASLQTSNENVDE